MVPIAVSILEEGFKDMIWEATGGRGFEQVIETAGVEFTEKLSLEIASNKGKVMFIGTPLNLLPWSLENLNISTERS